jgi:hypothetical protein
LFPAHPFWPGSPAGLELPSLDVDEHWVAGRVNAR